MEAQPRDRRDGLRRWLSCPPRVIKWGGGDDTLPEVTVHPHWGQAAVYNHRCLGHRGKSWGVHGASAPLEGKAEAAVNPKASRECCWGCKAPSPWWGGLLLAPWQPPEGWGDAGELQAGEGVPHGCGETKRAGSGGGGAGGKALAGLLSLLPPAQQSSPRRGDNVPKGKIPSTSPGRGWQGGGQPHCPPPGHVPTWHRTGTPFQEGKAEGAGVRCRPPASPPSLTCGMSPAVSLATAMASRTPRAEFPCLPCDVIRRFPGNPASGSRRWQAGRGGPQPTHRLLPCPAARHPKAKHPWKGRACVVARGGLGWLWLSGGDRLAGPFQSQGWEDTANGLWGVGALPGTHRAGSLLSSLKVPRGSAWCWGAQWVGSLRW